MRASFRLAARARLVLRLPGVCFVSETRAARCVRPTSASHYFLRLRAPVSRRFSIRVGAAWAPRVSRARSVSRHSGRFGGSRAASSWRSVGRSLPRARRATEPLALPSPHPPCSFSKGATRARPRPLLPGRRVKAKPCSTIRSAFHHRGSAPSSRTPFRAPGLGSVLRTTRDSLHVRVPLLVSVSPAPPRGSPLSAACSARRALGPVRPDLVLFRKRRSIASLDRRRRPTTSATRHDPRAHPSSCRSSPVLCKKTAVFPVSNATLARCARGRT